MAKKILLADDSVTIQKVVELTFAEGDYEVTCVSNGKAAVEKIKSERPDILLCDVIMPEMNGYDVVSFVKQDPAYSSIPAILMTGTFEPFDEAKAKASGADTFITKPFDSKLLVDKVEELISRRVVYTAPEHEEPVQLFRNREELTLQPSVPDGFPTTDSEGDVLDESPFRPSTEAEEASVPPPSIQNSMMEETATSREEKASLSLDQPEVVAQKDVIFEPVSVGTEEPELESKGAEEDSSGIVPRGHEDFEAVDLGSMATEDSLPEGAMDEIVSPEDQKVSEEAAVSPSVQGEGDEDKPSAFGEPAGEVESAPFSVQSALEAETETPYSGQEETEPGTGGEFAEVTPDGLEEGTNLVSEPTYPEGVVEEKTPEQEKAPVFSGESAFQEEVGPQAPPLEVTTVEEENKTDAPPLGVSTVEEEDRTEAPWKVEAYEGSDQKAFDSSDLTVSPREAVPTSAASFESESEYEDETGREGEEPPLAGGPPDSAMPMRSEETADEAAESTTGEEPLEAGSVSEEVAASTCEAVHGGEGLVSDTEEAVAKEGLDTADLKGIQGEEPPSDGGPPDFEMPAHLEERAEGVLEEFSFPNDRGVPVKEEAYSSEELFESPIPGEEGMEPEETADEAAESTIGEEPLEEGAVSEEATAKEDLDTADLKGIQSVEGVAEGAPPPETAQEESAGEEHHAVSVEEPVEEEQPVETGDVHEEPVVDENLEVAVPESAAVCEEEGGLEEVSSLASAPVEPEEVREMVRRVVEEMLPEIVKKAVEEALREQLSPIVASAVDEAVVAKGEVEAPTLPDEKVREAVTGLGSDFFAQIINDIAPGLLTPIAWEVIPELAETIIKRRIKDLESEGN